MCGKHYGVTTCEIIIIITSLPIYYYLLTYSTTSGKCHRRHFAWIAVYLAYSGTRSSSILYTVTGVELDLITDTDVYQMVERGISKISHRYATWNHPNMNTYNENEETRTLTYQDANVPTTSC